MFTNQLSNKLKTTKTKTDLLPLAKHFQDQIKIKCTCL